MLIRLLLLFTLVPLVELTLLVEVGRRVGMGPTIAVVLITGALGAWLARHQGLSTLARLRAELGRGELPAQTLLDGGLILVAAAVLLTPGFLTDALGFFLLVPAGRRVVRRAVTQRFRRRMASGGGPVIDASWERSP